MLFSRPKTPAPPTAETGRLVIEQVADLAVVGWAADAQGLPVDTLVLWQDGRCWPVHAHWTERQDVCHSLGVPAQGRHGFAFDLPAALWSDAQQPLIGLRLRAGSVDSALPDLASLEAHILAVRELPAGRQKELALRRCVTAAAHIGGPAGLGAEAGPWLQAAAQSRGLERALTHADTPPSPPATVHGTLETTDALVWAGWAWAEGRAQEQLSLHCGNEQIPASVVRIERQDVQQATGAGRLQLGFELELPGHLWTRADAQGEVALTLCVDHQPLTAQPVRLQRGQLLVGLDALRLAPPPADETPDQTQERQYRTLLLLEHIAAAGLQGALSPAQAAFVALQADRFQLQSLLGPLGAPSGAPLAAPAHDLGTVTVWRLLKQFNERLPGDGDAAQAASALAQLLQAHSLTAETRQRLLQSVMPYFCGLGAYHLLRPGLDAPQLRAMATSPSAWALSLSLVERVACADLPAAAEVLDRLNAAPTGWLNTECLAEAARGLRRDGPRDPQRDEAVLQVVQGLLTLLDTQAASYWGRAQDRHLIDVDITLLDLAADLPAPAAHHIEQAVLRHHALTPAFWDRLRVRCPDDRLWPAAMRAAGWRHQQVRQALVERRGPLPAAEVWALLALLAPARALGNLDAALITREWLLASLPTLHTEADRRAAQAALAALDPAEPIRLAAHPLAGPIATAEAPALADLLRTRSGVPHPPERARLVRCLAALRSEADATPVDETDLRRLADRRHHFIGVRLATWHWMQQRTQRGPAPAAALLALVRETWMAAFEASLDAATPAAALVGSWTALERLRNSAELDADALRLADEFRHALVARHGVGVLAALPPTGALQLRAAPGDGPSTLVAIYACRRNLDTRVRRIRETWARDLTARGIAWIVVVGDGDGQLAGDVLALPVSDAYEDLPAKTLALVHWVREHTNFDHLLKIDDDCHLAVDAFFAASTHLAQHYLGRRLHRAEGGTDRRWHQPRSASPLGASAIDKSPEPSLYADGGAGYALSRLAMDRLAQVLATRSGARLTRSAYMEDKLIGDLLALGQITLSDVGHETLVRRRFGANAVPVNAYQNIFYPGLSSPTVLTHLDEAEHLHPVEQGLARTGLTPHRIWPSDAPPVLGGVAGTNQLELLSAPSAVDALRQAPVLVVAVARNERLLMPHFLTHYRGLGVRHFVLVDNLSDDGTREYLMAQQDVVLYSADTPYRHAHYGVAWQQAVLANHALGKWVVLADIDEFLSYPGCETLALPDWLAQHDAAGADAVLTLMVDMYPPGPLATADFQHQAPFEAAPCFDRQPLLPWRLGSGCFSNGPTCLSALRHRLIADSAPNLYTSQKLAILRHQPWVRLSEGLHYAANLTVARDPAHFAHFKYHAGFQAKVREEVARQQHFNGAEEYAKYLAMLSETAQPLHDPALSTRYRDSASFSAADLG